MPVYMIRSGPGGPVKIGYTGTKLAFRIEALQHGNPERLVLLREIHGPRDMEAQFHFYFWRSHIRGEWFRFCEEMLTISPERVARRVKESGITINRAWLQFAAAGWNDGELEYTSWFPPAAREAIEARDE